MGMWTIRNDIFSKPAPEGWVPQPGESVCLPPKHPFMKSYDGVVIVAVHNAVNIRYWPRGTMYPYKQIVVPLTDLRPTPKRNKEEDA